MMQSFPPTVVWRHRKENLQKCSLRGLESRPDFEFYTYPTSMIPDLSNYIVLAIDAPPLSQNDADRGLFILDATWRYAEKMSQSVKTFGSVVYRSIPSHYRTSYPRRQTDCFDPERGLASIEAIYIAYHILGRDTSELLDNYHWKEAFLLKNSL
jgi:pre-rRNA-processing protein TSR3